MADFCKQCSIELFGKDMGDLANLGKGRPIQLEKGEGWFVLCEGCGSTCVNEDGECTYKYCEKHGEREGE